MKKLFGKIILIITVIVLCSCSGQPVPGPDKQGQGLLTGTLAGAGAGAITGAQVASATGPGALVGAGFGAIAGSIRGFAQDQIEEDLLKIARENSDQQAVAKAHKTIIEHYKRRAELHPARDVYPADLFFSADQYELKPNAVYLAEEIAALNIYRFPWSRFVITSYVKSASEDSEFAKDLARRRAESLADVFIKMGMNPRRVVAQAAVVPAPVLIDPFDRRDRYSQAIELTPVDR